MIRSLFHRNHNFIEVYDNALSKKECKILINQFEKSDEKDWGLTSGGYEPDRKKCMQMHLDLNDSSVISNIVTSKLFSCMRKYGEKYHDNLHYTCTWDFFPEASFQKYDGREDGYKIWHCEHSPGTPFSERLMAWMFYLNDAKCGTEFAYFPTINSKAGRCVIWPSFWTHTHKGVTPNIGLKYIITGWISYD